MYVQQTSREAYESVGRGCNSLEAKHQSMSAQIRKGVLDGDIEDTGDKRPTRSNRQAIVWALKVGEALDPRDHLRPPLT